MEYFYNDQAAVPSNINNQELKSEINFVIQSNTQSKHNTNTQKHYAGLPWHNLPTILWYIAIGYW